MQYFISFKCAKICFGNKLILIDGIIFEKVGELGPENI